MDTKEYIPSNNFINLEKVMSLKKEERKAVIIGAGHWSVFDDADKKEEKPTIVVELNGEQMYWTLNKVSNQVIGDALDTYMTEEWVGAVIEFSVFKQGKIKYVTCEVLEKPRDGTTNKP